MIVPLWIKKQSHQNIIAVFHYVIKEVRFVRAARKLFLSSLSQGIFTEWYIFSVSFLLWKKRSFGPVTHGHQLVSCVVMTLTRESDFKEIRSKNKSAWQEYSGVACSFFDTSDAQIISLCIRCISLRGSTAACDSKTVLEISDRPVVRDDQKVYRATNF